MTGGEYIELGFSPLSVRDVLYFAPLEICDKDCCHYFLKCPFEIISVDGLQSKLEQQSMTVRMRGLDSVCVSGCVCVCVGC